mmetsp:Transcript_22607/g.25171  ORF Transcript_22607/g.25171 Transcript_22607/m.25171 type:complete len:301 (-) Transcript_22607:438-1340(-)
MAVGGWEGIEVGFEVVTAVGVAVGIAVGVAVGMAVGGWEGIEVGFGVGTAVGVAVGCAVGGATVDVGWLVGGGVGIVVGGLVGGPCVGEDVGLPSSNTKPKSMSRLYTPYVGAALLVLQESISPLYGVRAPSEFNSGNPSTFIVGRRDIASLKSTHIATSDLASSLNKYNPSSSVTVLWSSIPVLRSISNTRRPGIPTSLGPCNPSSSISNHTRSPHPAGASMKPKSIDQSTTTEASGVTNIAQVAFSMPFPKSRCSGIPSESIVSSLPTFGKVGIIIFGEDTELTLTHIMYCVFGSTSK